MKCPHCLVEFHDNSRSVDLGNDVDGFWDIEIKRCSACKRDIYSFRLYEQMKNLSGQVFNKRPLKVSLIRPKVSGRQPIPEEVPKDFAEDYLEACLVIADSPKASAALSRRCLQNIIREKLEIKHRTLDAEIQQVIDDARVSAGLIDSIDAIRNIGNFAAHPMKSNSTGEIVEVEPHEAEWNLEVIEMMFDELFVRPAIIKKKRDALNAKLGDVGKTQMK